MITKENVKLLLVSAGYVILVIVFWIGCAGCAGTIGTKTISLQGSLASGGQLITAGITVNSNNIAIIGGLDKASSATNSTDGSAK